MAFASLWLRTSPLMFKFSQTITWLLSINLRDSLCKKSIRALLIFSCALATSLLALFLELEPSCFRDNLRCFRFKLPSCFLRCRGLLYLLPSLVMQ